MLPGNYCPEGTGATPVPCPPGKYSPDTGLSTESQCAPCLASFYCPLLVQNVGRVTEFYRKYDAEL